MISKELLSEVLDREVSSFQTAGNPNDLAIGFKDGNSYSSFDLCLNIYELAHKCKEWALQQGHILSSWETNPNSGVEAYCRSNNVDRFPFQDTTEPETIFRACQWVLDNKDEKCG